MTKVISLFSKVLSVLITVISVFLALMGLILIIMGVIDKVISMLIVGIVFVCVAIIGLVSSKRLFQTNRDKCFKGGVVNYELYQKNQALEARISELSNEIISLNAERVPESGEIVDLNQIIVSLKSEIQLLKDEISKYQVSIKQLANKKSELNLEVEKIQKQLAVFESEIDFQECGLYTPNFVFANSDMYEAELKNIREQQKDLIKKDKAALGSTNWTVNGSLAQGLSMVKDNKKLLLRAFNTECDDIVSNVRVSNFDRSKERIYKISEQISRLGKTMSISITPSYIALKIRELELALDFHQKKQEEKEIQKELRAQAREEAKVLKEIEEEKARLFKEQSHYQNALKIIISQIENHGDNEELLMKKIQLENQINDTIKAIENVDFREANRRAGYVYIISNIGAFGENVYKIGMTRRLDPHERVDELGDASVPFNFDIHALIFSEDAPSLEKALHNAFESKKLNKINTRREFFAVSLDEIKAEVRKNFDKTVEWIEVPEAEQYRQSLLINQ